MENRPPSRAIDHWLSALGYNAEAFKNALHVKSATKNNTKPTAYSREINALLSDDLTSADVAVFEVEQVPTVCFIDAQGKLTTDSILLDEIRKKIWNQSLISLVLVFDEQVAHAYPIQKDFNHLDLQPVKLTLDQPESYSPFSVGSLLSGELQGQHPSWFKPESKVDRHLLQNLKDSVASLTKLSLNRDSAQFLLGQCLFVSYLEHREIVGELYRTKHGVACLHGLIRQGDNTGLVKLFKQLKQDFNGDFLDSQNIPHDAQWSNIATNVFGLLDKFLSRTEISSGQTAFEGKDWAYDFRYIPVELISGIYETFLGDDQAALGAYYTPRHLANVAVDQAFKGVADICDEVVYDGACGSGILLTTAFRRMICAKEYQTGAELSFADRCALLKQAIKGSDINRDACRLTAFSLYLSLLENLNPSDITKLQDDSNTKLPTLIGETIWCGDIDGDFFNDSSKSKVGICTIVLSNPPWKARPEQDKNAPIPTFLTWSASHKQIAPLKQIAATYAQKALTAVKAGGRVCLILPASLLAAPTYQPFLRGWLHDAKLDRVINFSDSRRLLFSGAVNPCVIALAQPREESERGRISYKEYFDYWVPKIDVSLAFGRLTVHGTDKHKLPTQALWQDNLLLRTYLWGNAHDEALIGKLKLLGIIEDLTKGKNAPWAICKGFHKTDKSRTPLEPKHLKDMLYLDARHVPRDTPILSDQQLTQFPENITTVTDYGPNDGRAFAGPRIIFTDGVSTNFELRAVFSEQRFSFQTAIGAICGQQHDGDLIRFLTMYLRSKLVKYFLLHTAYSLTSERSAIKLNVLKELPFTTTEQHPNPKRALEIVRAVASITRRWEDKDMLVKETDDASWTAEAEELIFEYFELTENDKLLVEDACSIMIPSVQPSGYSDIRTTYSKNAQIADSEKYASHLMQELQRISKQLGGVGGMTIEILTHSVRSNHQGIQLGIVKIFTSENDVLVPLVENDDIVKNILTHLNEVGLLSLEALGNLHLSSDFLVRAGDTIYLIKPMVKRLWLASQALRDALRIVEAVR